MLVDWTWGMSAEVRTRMSIFKGTEVRGTISHKSAYVHLVGMCRVKAEIIFRNCLRSVRILSQGYLTECSIDVHIFFKAQSTEFV